MAISTTATSSWDQAAYDKLTYFALRAQLYADAMADVMPTNQSMPGTSVIFNQTADLAAATATLNESTDLTPATMSDAQVTVTLLEKGNVVGRTAKLGGTSYIPVDPVMANLIGYNAGLSLDTIAFDVLAGGSNVRRTAWNSGRKTLSKYRGGLPLRRVPQYGTLRSYGNPREVENSAGLSSWHCRCRWTCGPSCRPKTQPEATPSLNAIPGRDRCDEHGSTSNRSACCNLRRERFYLQEGEGSPQDNVSVEGDRLGRRRGSQGATAVPVRQSGPSRNHHRVLRATWRDADAVASSRRGRGTGPSRRLLQPVARPRGRSTPAETEREGARHRRVMRQSELHGNMQSHAEMTWPANQAVTNLYASGGTTLPTARNTIEPEDVLRAANVRRALAELRGANVMPFGSYYAAFIHPDVSYDLRGETGAAAWRDPHTYSQPGEIWTGEVGAFEGFRFVESPRTPVFADAGSSTTLNTMGVDKSPLNTGNAETPTRGKPASKCSMAVAAAETKRGDCNVAIHNTGSRQSSWLHHEQVSVRTVCRVEHGEMQGLPRARQGGREEATREGLRPRTRDFVRLRAPRVSMPGLRGSSQCTEPCGVRAEQGDAPAEVLALAQDREGVTPLSVGAAGPSQEAQGSGQGDEAVRVASRQRPVFLLWRARWSHRTHSVVRSWRWHRMDESHRCVRLVQCAQAQPHSRRVPAVHAEAIVQAHANTKRGNPCTDVYSTLFIGRQALAKAYSTTDGNGAMPKVVLSPVVDLLARYRHLGWYWLGGYGRFREASLRRVESSSSIGTNA